MARRRREMSDSETTDDQEYEVSRRGRNMVYRCKKCSYKSERRFNVRRHERRIHLKKIVRKCCGTEITTKGEWYKHCDLHHPGKRPVSKILFPTPKPKRSRSPGSSSDTSESTHISISPQQRRFSSRLREKALNSLQKPKILDFSEEEDSNEPRDYSLKHLDSLQQNSLLEKSSDDPEETSSAITEENYWNQSLETEEEIIETEFGISEHMGLDAFIEEIPLNLEPTQDFLQTLEDPGDVSGDLLFIPGDEEVEETPEENQVLQEINHNNIIFNNNNYCVDKSSVSALLWKVEESKEHENENEKEDLENLPPKKKILKKYRSNFGKDKENQSPGVKEEGKGDFWREVTVMQRNYLSSIDFERYKV